MFQLSTLSNDLQRSLLNSRLDRYYKHVFYTTAMEIFKGVSFRGQLSRPVVLAVDFSQSEPALIAVVSIRNQAHDYDYTFQFEAWPCKESCEVTARWLGLLNVPLPVPKVKVSFVAERNSVAYFDFASEGDFIKVRDEVKSALQ